MGCLPTSPSTEMGSAADRQRIQRIMAPERRQGGSLSPRDPHTVCGNQVSPALSQVSLGAHTVERWVLSGPGGQGPGHSPQGTEAAGMPLFQLHPDTKGVGHNYKERPNNCIRLLHLPGKATRMASPPPPFPSPSLSPPSPSFPSVPPSRSLSLWLGQSSCWLPSHPFPTWHCLGLNTLPSSPH